MISIMKEGEAEIGREGRAVAVVAALVPVLGKVSIPGLRQSQKAPL